MADKATTTTNKKEQQKQKKSSTSTTTRRRESLDEMGRSIKEKSKVKKPKERWLLTRKTWRYMTDAGKKLIPDGAQNRPEDIPKIEAYFQEVCKKEPKFLLWRKNSYPGALAFRKRRKDWRKGGSCRKAISEDEVHASSSTNTQTQKPLRPKDLALNFYPSTSGGRFDIQKMKYDFLNNKTTTPSPSSPTKTFSPSSSSNTKQAEEQKVVEEGERQLMTMLEQYLNLNSNPKNQQQTKNLNHDELVDRLQRHLTLVSRNIPSSYSAAGKTTTMPINFEGDLVQKSLSETLSRYFSQYPNRDKVISDLLTDRKALEKLYFELRKTKGFSHNRSGTSYTKGATIGPWTPNLLEKSRKQYENLDKDKSKQKMVCVPPVIEIQKVKKLENRGVQTRKISDEVLLKCEEEYKKVQAEKEEELRQEVKQHHRRRSSVDNDDVSQSVSDTIKRYLRMARKKSVDSDKADRFKRVNYDRNLRNIKAKGEITKPGDDDGLNKGCQTNDDWILIYRDLVFDDEVGVDSCAGPAGEFVGDSRMSSSRSSFDESSVPSSPGFSIPGHSFFSNLLHHHNKHHNQHQNDKNAGLNSGVAMQKSKSSSSVVHHGSKLMAKKIFSRSRSKSQSRVALTPSVWTPQKSCVWSSVTGKQVVLTDTNLVNLSEVERKVLQKVALAKLQALNLGVTVKVPPESTPVGKPKRRPYLLKRKALTTGFFDSGSRKDSGDKEKDNSTSGGLVFGIPLSQCVENDRLSRLTSGSSPFRSRTELSGGTEESLPIGRTGSRASFSSLIDAPRGEESDSSESFLTRDRMIGSVPGLLDALSCGSTSDIPTTIADSEGPAVPNILNVCFRHLETHGLRTLGIFRVSTSKKRIRQLREDFDCGKETSLDDEQCPHDVATLLKEYLRDLPDPLLCRDLYHAFIQTQRIRNRRLQLEALQHLVQLLPTANRDTLWALLSFLVMVAKNSADSKSIHGEEIPGNKMDSTNLATVFAPNILHCIKPGSSKDASSDRPEDRLDVINVVRTLIDNYINLFVVPAELLDEVYIHMMDSHPEALDQILNKKEATTPTEEFQDDFDSESNSANFPTASNLAVEYHHNILGDTDGRDTPPEPKRTWSREECLHETAATGGPNVAMRIRHKDKIRERNIKKRRDESSRKKSDEAQSPSAMSSARTIFSRLVDSHQYSKTRSSSLESSASQQEVVETRTTTRNRMEESSSAVDRRKSTPYILDNSGVITASLTIPVQTSSSNQGIAYVDDDIPYIEDGGNYGDGRQQMTIGVVRTPTAPLRRRQRSISGSDSSAGSAIQAITGSISLIQGYDSALGSSVTTFSTPLQNTTPSSVASSFSEAASPPSWASSPPTSPDALYAPEEVPTSPKMVVTHTKSTVQKGGTKEAPILQKVKVTSTTEIQQHRKRSTADARPAKEVLKSTSTPSVVQNAQVQHLYDNPQVPRVEGSRYTPSITSIGNAVLRSRTQDFERIAKTEAKTLKNTNTATTVTSSSSSDKDKDKKKYAKRRYTDSRHPTTHIPDAGSLESASSSHQRTSNSSSKEDERTNTTLPTVYKRRELISSSK